ncbi:LIM domain transcription factor LMO4 isoform X1 [Phodopus roborovskii]|uniref:LIM domain transcription factor LMO4 isoform X1 n=1 Tax=Phodopus roborovskii TaxID=109678 RepID=UPI0021E4D608|nr:LIM domain transcription factor LMO4 isoform X1 [Phodopus roborovskii]
MAVTTMACERCCLKYEKPVSQLYTRHPPLLSPPCLPSHHLHLPLGLSLPPLPRPPPPALQKAPNYLQLRNCSLTNPGRAREGTWLRRGGHLQRPAAGSRGSAGAGEGPGAATMVNPGSSSQPPPVTAGSLSWKRCAGCGGKIADRFLLYAMDSYWHSRCLKCSCCQAQLGDIGTSCYTKSGMILCRNDYIRLFGNSGACSACGQSIPASELVMRAQGNVYHLKCFTCSTCRNRLVPGDRFHYINGSLFCEHDRPTALINGHLNSLQSNPLLPDQKVC